MPFSLLEFFMKDISVYSHEADFFAHPQKGYIQDWMDRRK